MRFLRYFLLICTALILTINSLPLYAATSALPTWDKRWQCGKEIPIKKATIQYLKARKKLLAYRLKGKALPLLISEDYNGTGMIVFTRLNKRWRAYPITKSSIPMGVYSTASHFRISLFAMSNRHQFTALNIKNQLRNIQCRNLPVPAGIKRNSMQYLSVQYFNVLPSGNGQLISAAYDASKVGKTKLRWFRSHTNDWGYHWDKPGPIQAPKKKYVLKGSFIKAQEFPAPWWLISSLLKQAR
ncbi:hypothetical protein [Leucothrix arctica]|uniref:Uncharacterized protein n=1 Tax=Leucothrix arctica TaxID=1481894 RepID=A0A317CC88_9GAMM|nr:hypothetical protein [Leucothrix arctica]PWQ96305.1 hypothetical protein DKT75_09985 [Leucothrix arctica]